MASKISPSFTHAELQPIVQSAFLRSFTTLPRLVPFAGGLICLCGASSDWSAGKGFRGKAVVLGRPTPEMLPYLGLRRDDTLPPLDGQDACPLAEGDLPHTESPASLEYAEQTLCAMLTSSLRHRPFTRFDYTDEWNNLGFGRIQCDESLWAAFGGIVPDGALELASMRIATAGTFSAYAGAYLTLLDTPCASVLWCARPVGPVDSTEWTIIERFFSDWRAEDMPCLPCLCQTPVGCSCLVTMRLDCDEDIASARPLFEWYASERIPFSLAVKTSLPMAAENLALLNDVRAAGGSLLSHTHTHQYNWGPDRAGALNESLESRQSFSRVWPHLSPPHLAVSPFHTNPPYALEAMVQAGFRGFVSGIIHNDPEYLLGRAGVVPYVPGIVSISQQSMLHGDCYARQGEQVGTYLQAFAVQNAAQGIYGYLDHPFSLRYQYDWSNEGQRIRAHQQLVAGIRAYENVWFWNQEQCFDFVQTLASVRLEVRNDGKVAATLLRPSQHKVMYRYHGEEIEL